MRDDPIVPETVTLFLCGDVMTGRGVDQIQPRPSAPALAEPLVADARDYVALAESVNGPIPRAVEPAYVWGDALAALERGRPEARIVNLETSVTTSEDRWPDKGIHYRMHPANLPVLTVAGIDVAVLANNHVLDYGRRGLVETLDSLHACGVATAGAGCDRDEAETPAVVALPGASRLLVFACATESSGVAPGWQAGEDRPGIDVLSDLSKKGAATLAARVASIKTAGDVAVVSIHWGGNWGYDVPPAHVSFARALIDGGVDLVFGHSSHHPRPIEVYRDRLILYGCGDFIDDYEGIEGYEAYRDDLMLMYFVTLAPRTGRLLAVKLTPLRIRSLRLQRASRADADWLCETLDRISTPFGSHVVPGPEGSLSVTWQARASPPEALVAVLRQDVMNRFHTDLDGA